MSTDYSVSSERVAPAASLPRHIPALDGLRGLAILLVFFHHAAVFAAEPITVVDKSFTYFLVSFGWAGVDLFFVLSGFLITGILYDAKGGENFFRTFYMRRTLRIFPLYYGFCFFLFVILPRLATTQPERIVELSQAAPWYILYLSNIPLALANDWGPAVANTGHFWSLAVEEQFYLLWPLIVYSLSRPKLVRLCVALALGSLLFRIGWVVSTGAGFGPYVLLPGRLDSLMVGASLALMARGPQGLKVLLPYRKVVAGSALAVLAMIAVFYRISYWDRPLMQTIGFSALALLFGSIVLSAVSSTQEGRPSWLLTSAGLRFFGKYSYSLYLLSPLTTVVAATIGLEKGNFPVLLGSQIPGILLFATLKLAVAIPLSLASWYLFEMHFLKLKALFEYRRPVTTPAAIVPASVGSVVLPTPSGVSPGTS